MSEKPAQVTITIPSNRIYLDALTDEERGSLALTQYAFSRARETLYNLKYNAAFLNKKVANETAYIKRWMGEVLGLTPQDYYVASLMSVTNGVVSSQKELASLYKQQDELAHKSRVKKLASLKRYLTMCLNSKASLIKYSKSIKNKKTKPPHIPKKLMKFFPKDAADEKEAIYLYEVRLDKEIRRIKSRIAFITEKDSKARPAIPSRITFGGKAFYRKKDTTDISKEEWHSIRDGKRYKNINFSGRFDAKYKNWLVRYDMKTKTMSITMMDGNVVVFKGVDFPYRREDLKSILSHPKEKGYSVGYSMEFHTDHKGRQYILMKASFTLTKKRVNHYTGDGVISVDLNYDNISLSELDGEGRRIHGYMIPFDLEGKTSHQIDDILGRACSLVIDMCRKSKKPLVMEKIDMTKKGASMSYGNKKANRRAKMFAYKKMAAFLKGKAFQNDIGVTEVNPAYTSFLAKVKYMRKMRCRIHVAASYTIGRRGMGFSEKIPSYLKELVPDAKRRSHRWKQYAHLYKILEDIDPRAFKRWLPVFYNKKELTVFNKYA